MNVEIKIRKELKDHTSKKNQEGAQRFFKEKIKCYGLASKDMSSISKSYFKLVKDLDKEEVINICESMFKSGYLEEFLIASDWVYRLKDKYKKSDFKVFEKWVEKYITNWAECDTFCNHVMGSFLEMFPDYIDKIKKWTKSTNKWVRRASAVSLIAPARKGLFLNDSIEICDSLLMDTEDMVQKGYGWLLKVLSDTYQKRVFDYVLANKHRMPRTALRYAIEKMPQNLRKKAMEK